jgi:YD repeat-containing protein
MIARMNWLPFALLGLGLGCGSASALSSSESVPLAADTAFTLERSECFGFCPSYSVRIASDGAVSYDGRRFVRVKGGASGNVSEDAVRRLLTEFFAADYWDLTVPANCPTWVTDEPGAITSLTWNGHSHRVEHNHGNPCAPMILFSLEQEIDDVAGTSQWVNCAPAPNCN